MSLRISIFLILAGAASAWAGSVSLSVEGAAAFALRHNPSLAAARLRIEEARGDLQQSGRLSNPMLDVDFARATRGPEGTLEVALVQRFPLTARLRHERAASRAQLAAAEAEVRDAERKLAADVRTAAVKLLALQGQRSLRRQQLGTSRELLDFLTRRVAAGEASAVDAAQVELESRQIEVENLTLAADEAVLLGDLRTLLGVERADTVAITGELPAPQRLPADREVTQRADLLAASSRAEAARAVVLEQRARRWEDVSFGLTYGRDRIDDTPQPVTDFNVVGFRFSLPLPIWNTNAGHIREAEAAATRAGKQVEAVRRQANAEAAAALGAMRAYAELIARLDDQVLPAATRIVEQLRTNFSTGLTPLTDVLRARTRQLELQRQRVDALRDYQLARIRHQAALGTAPAPTGDAAR